MVRQSLDNDAAYADVVIHGNGMPGLQWRSKQGEDTAGVVCSHQADKSDTAVFPDVSVEAQAQPVPKAQ
jgi:hypothetical protein